MTDKGPLLLLIGASCPLALKRWDYGSDAGKTMENGKTMS
jgi:hypothetical protein